MSNPGQLAGVFSVLLKERADDLLPPLPSDRVRPGQDRGAAGHWAEESHRAAEEVRITPKTLLELPEPAPPPQLPDHPARQQIMAVLTTAGVPLRARQMCEAMDLQIAPDTVKNTRVKLKRLAERGILAETEQGLPTQPRP
ncbi:hypothetical protein OH768_29070 [Streptomyces sp. NBC_01622]|uniref:hypothetical protein n=1 Tax=Streptomyces sp. NBC_01622 TaxID=2975903 RepID=UPI00386792CD|nr:hypothetical protein OH768_29070 [Streptomyces sp. NBC_01622]